MIITFVNLLILIIPFCLILLFENKKEGFVKILTFIIVFHLIIGFTTQLLHIFRYETILYINGFIGILSLVLLYKNKEKITSFRKTNLNFFVIMGFIIILFQLTSVHYLHSGTISSINGYDKVKNNSYIYPYFSDEWIGASLIKHTTNENTLPIQNTLIKDNPRLINPLFISFSFLANFFLLLQLDPIFNYHLFSILSGFIICFLVYIYLRVNKVDNFISILSAILITYITNSGNLPGIWYLLPYTLGLIMLLLGLISIKLNRHKLALWQFILSIIFYTPIIVFIIPIIFSQLFLKNNNKNNIKLFTIFMLAILILVYLIIGVVINNFHISFVLQAFYGYLIRPILDIGIPKYAIWNVLPIITLPFVSIGLIELYKRKKFELLSPILIGFMFWILYIFLNKVFIIEYPRIVVITSVLLIISSGFGLDWLKEKYFQKSNTNSSKNQYRVLKIIIFIILIIISFSYTKRERWPKLVLKTEINNKKAQFIPAAPINHYLTSDDLFLFKNIKHKQFIAPAWKGLVIGIATDNYPLESKSSIFSTKKLSYRDFLSSDCSKKNILSKEFSIDYVYSENFNCENFELIGTSKEKLFLYKSEGSR